MSDTMSLPLASVLAALRRTSSVPDYTNQYNTQLTPVGEQLFQQQMGHRMGDLRDYDLRGAWLSNAQAASNGHLTDLYKKPNHPTFSSGSIYSGGDQSGGNWAQLPGGQTAPWSFTPSQTNQNLYGSGNLADYFSANEPGNLLLSGGSR